MYFECVCVCERVRERLLVALSAGKRFMSCGLSWLFASDSDRTPNPRGDNLSGTIEPSNGGWIMWCVELLVPLTKWTRSTIQSISITRWHKHTHTHTIFTIHLMQNKTPTMPSSTLEPCHCGNFSEGKKMRCVWCVKQTIGGRTVERGQKMENKRLYGTFFETN